MSFKLILVLIIVLKAARCSLVFDTISQKGLYVSEYCPSSKLCKQGSHVMCMFYDANHVMGPRCSNAMNVTITADLANQLLDVMNAIRSKIANGMETGKNGAILPRGYGIFKLRWDNELATLAQVLANQCMLRHDLCRATKKFPQPGQAVGQVRFTYPNWDPISKGQVTLSSGLTAVKLGYAITQILKSWYGQKSAVTEQMVRNYPDWALTPQNQAGKLYLNMIHGLSTHVGCGMSAYSEYNYYDNYRQGTNPYNSILVICNYSSEPVAGRVTYTSEPPIPGRGYSPQCGCPEGYTEDQDCLCVERPAAERTVAECASDARGNCEPTVVLLPIFSIENAPPEKLYDQANQIKEPLKKFILQRLDNSSIGRKSRTSVEEFNFVGEADRENLFQQPAAVPHSLKTVLMSSKLQDNEIFHRAFAQNHEPALPKRLPRPPPRPHQPRRPPPPPPRPVPPPPRRPPPPPPPPPQPPPPLPPLPPPPPPPPPPPTPQPPPPPTPPLTPPSAPKPPVLPNKDYTAETPKSPYQANNEHEEPRRTPQVWKQQLRHIPIRQKSSIFTRVAQFKLPGRKHLDTSYEPFKKDVTPRKDFDKLQKVVHDYMKRRPGYRREEAGGESHQNEDIATQDQDKTTTTITKKQNMEDVTTETILNKAEQKVMNYNEYLKQRLNVSNTVKDIDVKDDTDNKLMSLLTNLEREVNHVELDGNEKELFDAKIRKIYGRVVGKQGTEILSPIKNNNNEPEGLEIDIGETKRYSKQENEKILEQQKTIKNSEIEKKVGRIKNYSDLKTRIENVNQNIFDDVDAKHVTVLDHKYNVNSDHKYVDHQYIMDNLDQKYNEKVDHKYSENFNRKYNERIDHKNNENIDRKDNDNMEHKYNENIDRKYNYNMEHKYNENSDRKYNENLDQKYNENIGHKYNEIIDHKYSENLDRKYNENSLDRKYNGKKYRFIDNNLNRKYDDSIPASRSQVRYEINKDIPEFKEYQQNTLTSLEESKYKHFGKHPDKTLIIEHDMADRNSYRKDTDRKHRHRDDLRSKALHFHTDINDPLSIERRKYYQEKLENAERKLRAHNYRRRNDARNDRQMRRMRPNRDGSSRSRAKALADNYYMPDRARFLHGF